LKPALLVISFPQLHLQITDSIVSPLFNCYNNQKTTLSFIKNQKPTTKMKATVASLLALAGSTMAAGAADTVNQVLTQIASDLKNFDSAIKAYSGDASNMIAASKKIGSTTTSGAQAIASGPELSLTDAVGITSNVQTLQASLDGTLNDLKAIGQKLAADGQCGSILSELSAQGTSAQALQDAITSKAPAETKSIAAQLGGAIGNSIAETNAYFSKACANAPKSSGGSPSGAGSPDMAGHGAAGGHGGSSPGSPSGPGGASPASGGAGGAGSKTNKASKTSSPPKPAVYAGAANVLTAPFMGALALAVFAL
jgi:hypothetical protein